MDSGDKASNKALSIAMKYALLQVFCIPTEDAKDPDADSPKPLPKPVTIETKPNPNMDTMKAVMSKLKPDGTPFFSETQKDAYRKKIKVYGLEETLKQAEIALEEMESIIKD